MKLRYAVQEVATRFGHAGKHCHFAHLVPAEEMYPTTAPGTLVGFVGGSHGIYLDDLTAEQAAELTVGAIFDVELTKAK